MRFIVVCVVLLIVMSGCGGSSSNSNQIKVTGTVVAYPEVSGVVVNAYTQGHVGEPEHLVATAQAPKGSFTLWMPTAGTYDLQVSCYYFFESGDGIPYRIDDKQPFLNKLITAPETNVGPLELQIRPL